MSDKLDSVLDTQARTQRFQHYDVKVVMVPFEHPRQLVRAFEKQKATIAADRHLTNEGKIAALAKARDTTRTAIAEWHEQRLKDIDADRLSQRAALMGNVERPDPGRIQRMASNLLKHSPEDIAVFYNSANEQERREMEAASAEVGRVPIKSASGLKWRTLLDPEMVEEAVLARAEATNPAAAQKVREIDEVRRMQVTITGVALSEV